MGEPIAELPEGLAQALAWLVGVIAVPQEVRQGLAWMGTIAVEQQIAEHLLYFGRIEAGEGVEEELEATQQRADEVGGVLREVTAEHEVRTAGGDARGGEQ